MSDYNEMVNSPEKTVCASIIGNLDQGSKQQLSQFMSHISQPVIVSGQRSNLDVVKKSQYEVKNDPKNDDEPQLATEPQEDGDDAEESKDDYYSSIDFHKSENRVDMAEEVNAAYKKVEPQPTEEDDDEDEEDDAIIQQDDGSGKSSDNSKKSAR